MMENPKLWRNTQASLLKFCNDLITKWALTDFKAFNFDTHASLNTIPESDLLGIAEMSMVNRQGTYEVSVNFVVCTGADDTYMDRLNPVIDYLFDELQPGRQPILIVNEKTAAVLGKLTVEDDVAVLPVASSKGRPIQVVSVVLASSLLVPP